MNNNCLIVYKCKMAAEKAHSFLVNDKEKPRGRKWRKERMAGKEIGNYKICERINKGGTAWIYDCENNGATKVCKVTDGKYSDTLLKEYSILRSLDHENIVKVFDCIACNRIVAMAMEGVRNGDLHDFIVHNWPVFPDQRRKFAKQILSAVESLHSVGVAHCDLKLENILLTKTRDIKIVDFGSALKLSETTCADFAYIATTPEYLPPEIICASADGSYDIRAIDEWSVGVVLFILLTGRFPFGEVDQSRIAKYIKRMRSSSSFELRQKEEHLLYIEADYLDMVRGLLQFEDTNRLPVAKVLQMPYFDNSTKLKIIEDEIDKDFEGIFDDL